MNKPPRGKICGVARTTPDGQIALVKDYKRVVLVLW